MDDFNKNNVLERKKIGAFYTPSKISRLLSNWAVRHKSDYVLEPSFGGCGFLESLRDRFDELGASRPSERLFGCDTDEAAFQHLKEKISPRNGTQRFILGDFLSLTPDNFPKHAFDVVVGNPPYISLHNMTISQKKEAVRAMKSGGFDLGGKASLWAYFILHALQFIRIGGRIAWLLPGSFLHTDYAKYIHQIFESNFERVIALSLRERLFLPEGAEESTVIVLAEGWGKGPAKFGIEFQYIHSMGDLTNIINSWPVQTHVGRLENRSLSSLLPKATYFALKKMKEEQNSKLLGDIAHIGIGIVTGSNNFFLLNNKLARENNLPFEVLRPIFTKFHQVNSLQLRKSVFKQLIINNERCLLLDTRGNNENDEAIQKYLETFSNIENVATFRKRSVWHQPDDGRIPDAFFSYMSTFGPRIVINSAKTTCTNSIHRVYFVNKISYDQKMLIAISLLSSFSQLSAEIEGRVYGSGVLKHEPNDAKRIALLLPSNIPSKDIRKTSSEINNLLKKGNKKKVGIIADRFLLNAIGNDKSGIFSDFRKHIDILQELRHKARQRNA